MRCDSEVQRETRSAVGSGVSPASKARRDAVVRDSAHDNNIPLGNNAYSH